MAGRQGSGHPGFHRPDPPPYAGGGRQSQRLANALLHGGVRIWVDRKGSATPELARRRIEHAATEHRLRLTPPLGADAGWVIVTHSDLVK